MKQGFKKALVMLLSVAMVFTFMAMPVYADDGAGGTSEDVITYDGDIVSFVKDDGSNFGMYTRLEGSAEVLNGNNVEIYYLPKTTTTYTSLYWGYINDENRTPNEFIKDGAYKLVVDSSKCGTMVAVAPLKDDGITTTGSQYYLAIPSADKIKAKADYTALDNALAEVPEDMSKYTDESVAVLTEALTLTKKDAFYYKNTEQQAEVDTVAAAINDAVAALVEKDVEPPEEDADYTAVDAAIAAIPADQSVYTDESVAALNTAVSAVVRGKKASEQAEVDAMAAAINATIEALELKSVEPSVLEDGVYTLPELTAGPSEMFNHFVANSKYLTVEGEKATIRFITDASTASIQKYSKIALGKSSELVETQYQADLPEGTTIIEGKLQPYDEGTDKDKYLFEIPLTKAEAEALLNNNVSEDIYITVWNKVGSSKEKIPGWYKASNDIYLSIGSLGERTTAPEEPEAFRFTLQVGQYVEGADFHTASFEGVTYSLKDANGNLYEPSNTTSGMLTYSNLSAVNTYTFNAAKEGWTVVTQGEWNVAAHAYEYIFTGEDEINVTITSADDGKNITESTNPGFVFRLKPKEQTALDIALEKVPDNLSIFTLQSVNTLQAAIDAADTEETNESKIQEMADAVMSGIQGLVPIDGYYSLEVETFNGMFLRYMQPVGLEVKNGEMTFHVKNGSQTFTKIFLGTEEQANAETTDDNMIFPGEECIISTASGNKNGYNWFIPVSNLEMQIPVAAYSKSKQTFNATGDFLIPADSLKPQLHDGTRTLSVYNETAMFKVVNAYIETNENVSELVFALSGNSYEYVIPSKYEDALARGADKSDWVKYTEAEVECIYEIPSGPQDEGVQTKFQFRIPIELKDYDELQIPLISVSKSREAAAETADPENPDYSNAFIARQIVLDLDNDIITVGDYRETIDAYAVSNIESFKVQNRAQFYTVGKPSANDWSIQPTFTLSESGSYDKAFIGTAEAAAAADEDALISIGADGKVTLPFWNNRGKTPQIVDGKATAAFHTIDTDLWVERTFTMDVAKRDLVIDGEECVVFKDSVEDATIDSIPAVTYNGKAHTPDVTVKYGEKTLVKDTDYTVSYLNNKNAGTATVTITGINDYKGTKTATFTINQAKQTITAKAKASTIFVGKSTTVTVSNAKENVKYKSSNTKIATVTSKGVVKALKAGTVKITVTAGGTNYVEDTKEVTIKVVPAATSSLTAANQATGVKLTWKKITGVTGYNVYRGTKLLKKITSASTVTYTDTKANTNGTKYTFKVVPYITSTDKSTVSGTSKSVTTYRVSRPAISSAKNSAAKKMTVKWGKNSKATGYQIQYSTSKNFSSYKSATVTKNSTVSKAIGSLKKGKTYYVRVRSYKTVSGKKYYSAWSVVKTVKITK